MNSFIRCLPVAMLGMVSALAQEAPKPAQAPKAAEEAKPPAAAKDQKAPVTATKDPAFVRRFSAGISLSILGRQAMTESVVAQQVNDALRIESSSEANGFRTGGGIIAQAAVTNRFAVAFAATYRRVKFNSTTLTYEGIDRTNTVVDERKLTTDVDKSRARHYDFTMLVRRYSKDRFDRGPRWFYEAGPAFRKTTNVSTSRERTVTGANTVCCTHDPAPVSKSLAKGFAAGIGLQLNDEIGVRIMPEFRYTRWFDRSFNNLSVLSARDQFEAVFSFMF